MKENFGALLMIEIKEKDLKEKENHYIKLVEEGEVILVEKSDGNKYMMVPQNPNDMKYQWDHDDGA